MKKLSKKIVSALENNDFSVCSIGEHDGETWAEIETYSPAGEDVIVVIWYDGTKRGFVRAFREYADGFDVDEHAEMWIDSRGKGGCPSTLRELIEDAEAIRDMLDNMATVLEAVR